MTLLDLALNDVPELKTVEAGTEVEVQLASFEKTESKAGKPMLSCRLQITSEADVQAVFNYLSLPVAEDDESTKNSKLRRIQRFADAFGIDYSSGSIDLEASVGKSAWVVLNEESDEEYGTRNTVKRFVTPK